MGDRLSATIDRRVEAFLLVRARRRWPVLTLVPSRALRPVLAPTRRRLRRNLTLAALAAPPAAALLADALL